MEVGVFAAVMHDAGSEFEQGTAPIVQVPVKPGDFGVLAIAVIVAALGAADLVATADHRNSLREQERRQEIVLLPLAKLEDGRVLGFTFGTAIPRMVVVRSVMVVIQIGFIVLGVVADQVVQSETIVR